ncbi:bifunctional aldolase/short-chain dehydrogenase [Alphaproteobacteria bacterium]|nr:bifunctional aldolase/short-chain dehydrogenase [Alphaproteobacteria bacterium]
MLFSDNWRDEECEKRRLTAGKSDFDRDLADRVYTSQLLGKVPDLVMHGGGNTSCKTKAKDLFDEEIDVLCIKGSGWDLGTIQAAGLPAVRLEPLLKLRNLAKLSDEDMVNVQRANLLDSSSPNPSVETLLHAFLPHKFIDHTHSTPFLTLANLPDPEAAMREIFGNRFAIVPYVMPGFDLAKLAAKIYDKKPDIDGLLLAKHGHFTWGDTAKESYDRVIDHTNRVDAWLQKYRSRPTVQVKRPEASKVQGFLQSLRGALSNCSGDATTSFIFDLIQTDDTLRFFAREDVASLAKSGVATPDHVIRMKAHPLLLEIEDIRKNTAELAKCIETYAENYQVYFERCAKSDHSAKKMLSPLPKLIWAKGVGLIGVGTTAKEARMITDLAQQNIRVMSDGADAGGFHPVQEQDLFDLEYWSLEQAKLGKSKPSKMQGQVVIVTGGAGVIGKAAAREFCAAGAEIMLVDKNADLLEAARSEVGPAVATLALDVTQLDAPERIMEAATMRFGGVDILISNAGAAHQSSVELLSQKSIRESFELNFFAHFSLAQAAYKTFRTQGIGGQVLFNVSKQAVNPGKNFGAYGLPKASLFFLVKQMALECGSDGVRVNGINADRIRSGLLDDALIAERATARGVDEATYLAGNLLHKEVEAHHVAEAFLALAMSKRTTGHVMTVDGGNIEASLR